MLNQSSARQSFPDTRNSSVALSRIEQNESGQTGLVNSAVTANRPRASGVRIRPVALPVEHGGWGLTLEPIALGFRLAPPVPSALLSRSPLPLFFTPPPL